MYHPTSAAEHVYQGVRRMIFSGALLSGERLVQRQLAERFGTSNIPVIEAIRRLEQDGLVVSRPNAGAQVQIWTARDVEGAYLVREALEGIACRLFVKQATQKDRATLQALNRRYKDARTGEDAFGWFDADVELHLHIARSTGSRPLQVAVEGAFGIAATMMGGHVMLEPPGNATADCRPPSSGLDGHDDIVAALMGADSDAAEKAGRAHVRNALEKVRLWGLLSEVAPGPKASRETSGAARRPRNPIKARAAGRRESRLNRV